MGRRGGRVARRVALAVLGLGTVALAATAIPGATPVAGAASSGEERAATIVGPGDPDRPHPAPLGGDAAPGVTRPGASLLLGIPPREVGFALDPPARPALPLLTTFRDASIERWGPLRVYTNNRWGRWMEGPWWTHVWAPRLGPGDDLDSDPSAAEAVDARPAMDRPPLATAAPDMPSWLPPPGDDPRLASATWLRDRSWLSASRTPVFDATGPNLVSDGFATVFRLPPTDPVVDWRCRRRPVTIIRYGAESDAVELVRCDGSIPPGAHDRLSILARPPEVPRPGDLLPDEPDPRAWAERREWVPDVRLVHPRLLWALQRLADEFPRRTMYLISGYRPLARVGGGTTDDDGHGHRSLHADGRAIDLHVHGVPDEKVFEACRKLKDVGCGYYPNSTFVHVDVRRAHSGKAFWIDASAPGEPSRYVDSWPGVVDSGAMGWLAPDQRVAGPSTSAVAPADTAPPSL